jgi:hypothetical protein
MKCVFPLLTTAPSQHKRNLRDHGKSWASGVGERRAWADMWWQRGWLSWNAADYAS